MYNTLSRCELTAAPVVVLVVVVVVVSDLLVVLQAPDSYLIAVNCC